MIESSVLLAVLTAFAWTDIREKEFPLFLPIAGAAAGVSLHLIFRAFPLYSLLGGVCVGGVLLIAALLSKGNIGIGDGLLFSVTGLYLGLWGNLALLFLSTLACAVTGLVMIASKRATRKKSLPLAPFVLVADVIMLVLRIG